MGGAGAGEWVPSFYLVTALLNDLSESFVLGQGQFSSYLPDFNAPNTNVNPTG